MSAGSRRQGMTPQQVEALALLRSHPALSGDELGALLGTSREGACRTASSLVRRGLVRRIRQHGRIVYEAPRQERPAEVDPRQRLRDAAAEAM